MSVLASFVMLFAGTSETSTMHLPIDGELAALKGIKWPRNKDGEQALVFSVDGNFLVSIATPKRKCLTFKTRWLTLSRDGGRLQSVTLILAECDTVASAYDEVKKLCQSLRVDKQAEISRFLNVLERGEKRGGRKSWAILEYRVGACVQVAPTVGRATWTVSFECCFFPNHKDIGYDEWDYLRHADPEIWKSINESAR